MFTTQPAWKVCTLAVAALLLAMTQSGAAQTPTTGRLMREKLTHAQHLLEALTTSNFALLERESDALAKIPLQPGWMVLHSPEYRQYSESFLRAVVDMNASAKARDMDEAAKQFQSLTMSCYQCHRYIKNSRLAQQPDGRSR
jgi:cytochrome c556